MEYFPETEFIVNTDKIIFDQAFLTPEEELE